MQEYGEWHVEYRNNRRTACHNYAMETVCRIVGCSTETVGRQTRCTEHSNTCVAEGCTTESKAVRCSRHAGSYWRLGASHISCRHVGCTILPMGDRAVCENHALGVSELQASLDAAVALLSEYGIVKFRRTQ